MHAPVLAAPTALRQWLGLAAFYAALFAVLGVYMQFFPVWLHDARGLGEEQVAVVLSAQTIARTVAGPLWSQRVDRSGRARGVLVLLSVLSLGAFLLFGIAHSTVWLWCCAFLFGCLYPPIHSILDALAMQTAHGAGFAYGRLRLVGSVAFLVVILLVGWWLEQVSIGVVFWLLVAGLAATALTSSCLPRPAPLPAAAEDERAPIATLLRSLPFVLLLVAAGLIQGSHATYYNLSTLHWRDHGIGKGMAGVLWAEGILAEIVLFFVARGSVERLRPTTLLMLGGGAAAVRWAVIGATTSVPVLLLTNWLHAFSFTATYLGSLRALERRTAANQRATAQGLLGAASSGVGMVAASLLGGYVYERWAGRAFFVMAAFAVAGVGIAFLLRRLADRAQPPQHASTRQSPA